MVLLSVGISGAYAYYSPSRVLLSQMQILKADLFAAIQAAQVSQAWTDLDRLERLAAHRFRQRSAAARSVKRPVIMPKL
jgi:hypothetical protein